MSPCLCLGHVSLLVGVNTYTTSDLATDSPTQPNPMILSDPESKQTGRQRKKMSVHTTTFIDYISNSNI